MFFIGSTADPYVFEELPVGSTTGDVGMTSYVDIDHKTQVSPALVPGQSTAVFLTAGQSLGMNCVCSAPNSGVLYTPTNTLVQNMNIYNGGVYKAVDPLLGNDNTLGGGTWQSRLGDKLITAGTYERVIFVPISIGGTIVSQWAAGGPLNQRLVVAVKRILAVNLPLTAFLWCQGETDATLGTSQGSYYNSLTSVINTVKSLTSTKFIIPTETWDDGGKPTGSSAVRAAQIQVVDNVTVFQGPDPDTLGNSYRFNGTHWNASGADAFASMWVTSIQDNL